jgi:hypothetical protein
MKGKRLDKALKKTVDAATSSKLVEMLEVPDARTR